MRKIILSSFFLAFNVTAKITPPNDVNLVRSKEDVQHCQFIDNVALAQKRKVLSLIQYLKNETSRLGGNTLLLITEVSNETYDTADVKIKEKKTYRCK